MAVAANTQQYLTFTLDEELYAVDVVKVREVLEVTPLTKIPRMPAFMQGVINIRGSVVPVLDLRLKFGMEQAERTVDTCIIVMDIQAEDKVVTIGSLADSVQEVIDLDEENIEPPPRLGTKVDTDFIRGMGKRDDQFIIILDIDRVFNSSEIAVAEDANAQTSTHDAKSSDGA
jgi:purine-binding chemotaxis protein CheW